MRNFKRFLSKQGATHLFHFDGRWAVREIRLYPDAICLFGRTECTESSIEEKRFTADEEITAEEFNREWERCMKLPHYVHGDDFLRDRGTPI